MADEELEYTVKEEKLLYSHVLEAFGKELFDPELRLTVEVKRVHRLDEDDVCSCLELLDRNLGPIYSAVNGVHWKSGKREEMAERGLVYVLIRGRDDEALVGFLSMKLVNDYELSVVYLYEIQLCGQWRNRGLGTSLMKQLDQIVPAINASGTLKKLWYRQYPEEYTDKNDPSLELSGIGLTVFSENQGAFNLYTKLGYVLHPDSPKDRVLRNGKIIKPQYYMLEKKL